MSLSWRILTSNTTEAWDLAARGASNATFFQTKAWADLFSKTFPSWKTDPVVIEFSDGNIMVLPTLKHSLTGYRECMVPHVYGGPMFSRPPLDEHLQVVNTALTWFGDVTFVENPFEPNRRDQDYLARWQMETTVTDLTPGYDSLWKLFRKNHRRNFKSAVKQGVTEDLARSVEDVNAYFEIYQDALKRWGEKANGFYPRALFRNMFEMPEFGKSIRMWVARKDGMVIGGTINVYHGSQVICWHAVYHSGYFSAHAAPLLIISAIENACKEGYRWFDLMGPNKHLKKVQHFKDGFATQPLPYNSYYSNNSIKGILFKRYRRLKEKSWKQCPM